MLDHAQQSDLSSVGRAEDCSGTKTRLVSLGHWFESGRSDFFLIFSFNFLPNPNPTCAFSLKQNTYIKASLLTLSLSLSLSVESKIQWLGA